MKPTRPVGIDIAAQEDGTVLVTIQLEPATEVLHFTLCSYDAQDAGLRLTHQATEATMMAQIAEFNSKAFEAVEQLGTYQES